MLQLAPSQPITWLVLAQIGPAIQALDEDGEPADHMIMNVIVMAERDSEAAAIAERDRRDALNDGRVHWVVTSEEYASMRSPRE